MHEEEWQERLAAWRQVEITRMASRTERREASIEQQRELLDAIRGLGELVELNTTLEAVTEGDPSLPWPDLRELACDLDAMIEERLPWHRGELHPPRLDDASLASEAVERPPYALDEAAGYLESEAVGMRTTAAMVRLRNVVRAKLDQEGGAGA